MNIESSQKLEQNKVSIVYAGTPVLSKKILEKLNENFWKIWKFETFESANKVLDNNFEILKIGL